MMITDSGESGIAPGCQEPGGSKGLGTGAAAEGVEGYDGIRLPPPRVDAEEEKFLNEVVRLVVEMKLVAPMLVSVEARLKRLEMRLEALEEV